MKLNMYLYSKDFVIKKISREFYKRVNYAEFYNERFVSK